MTGRLVTFYSFKGGVGCTHTLANVAVCLARGGKRVIVVDMDFESPGLSNFFGPAISRTWTHEELAQSRGVLDFLDEASQFPTQEPRIIPDLLSCVHTQLDGAAGSVRLLLPGRMDDTYPGRVATFSWDDLYRNQRGYDFMEVLRGQLVADADYVLVDSRTGMTDVAGICAFQWPDTVVALFALHRQGIEGIHLVTRIIEQTREQIRRHAAAEWSAATAGEGKDAARLAHVLLVPARVDEQGETHLRDEWLHAARRRLQSKGTTLLSDLDERIPYQASVAYGQQIVVGREPTPLSRAYEKLADELLTRAGHDTASERQRRASPIHDTSEALRCIERDVAELGRVAAAGPPGRRRPIQELLEQARQMSTLQESLQGQLRVIQDALEPWPDTSQPPHFELLHNAPDTVDAWQQLGAQLGDTVQGAFETWRAHWRKHFQDQLRREAGGDEQAIDDALKVVDEYLAAGDLEGLESRLSALTAQNADRFV